MPLNFSSADDGKRTVAKLNKVLELGKISSNEYFGNILESVVRTDRSVWLDCIAGVPLSLRVDFIDFARSHLLPVDYMPNPGIVFPSTESVEAVEMAKRQLRPRYIELLKVMEQVYFPGTTA